MHVSSIEFTCVDSMCGECLIEQEVDALRESICSMSRIAVSTSRLRLVGYGKVGSTVRG